MARKTFIMPNLQEIENFAARGLTLAQIAQLLGVAERTLYTKKAASQEFREAYDRGKTKGIAAVANKVWEMAVAGNLGAAIFFLKARAGWRENSAIEITGADGGPIELMTREAENYENKIKRVRELIFALNESGRLEALTAAVNGTARAVEEEA